MIEVGRVCVKIAGRDSGKKCVVVEVLEGSFVLIDGETRRRKCNIMHLEPVDETVKLAKGASHDAVCKALDIKAVHVKSKKPAARPRKVRKKKAPRAVKEPVKKEAPAKKEEPKADEPKKVEPPVKAEAPKETAPEKKAPEKDVVATKKETTAKKAPESKTE